MGILPNDIDPRRSDKNRYTKKPEPPKPIVAFEHTGTERALSPLVYVVVILSVVLALILFSFKTDLVCHQRVVSSAVERLLYTEDVGGSTPSFRNKEPVSVYSVKGEIPPPNVVNLANQPQG